MTKIVRDLFILMISIFIGSVGHSYCGGNKSQQLLQLKKQKDDYLGQISQLQASASRLHTVYSTKLAEFLNNQKRIAELESQVTGVGDAAFTEMQQLQSINASLNTEINNLSNQKREIQQQIENLRYEKIPQIERQIAALPKEIENNDRNDEECGGSKNVNQFADTYEDQQKREEEQRQRELAGESGSAYDPGAACIDKQTGQEIYSTVNPAAYEQCKAADQCETYTSICVGSLRTARQCTTQGQCTMDESARAVKTCQNACAKASQVCQGSQASYAAKNKLLCQAPQEGFVASDGVQRMGECADNQGMCYSYGYGDYGSGGGNNGTIPVPEPRPAYNGSGTTGSGNSVAGNNGTNPASTPPANKPYDGGDGESPYRDRQDSYDAQDEYAGNDKNQYNNGNNGGNGSSGGGYGGGQSPNLPGFNNGGPVTANNTDGSEVTGDSKRNYSSEAVGGGGAGNMENSPFGGGNNDYYSGGSANDYGTRGYKVASNEDHSGYSGGAPQAGLVADENSLNTAAASKASGNRLPDSSEKGNPSFFNHKNMGEGLGEWNGQKITEEGLRKGIYKGMSEKMRRDLLQQIADNVNRNFRLNSVRSTEIEKPILSDYSLKTFYTMPMYGDEALLEQACRSCREPIVIGKHKDGTPIYGAP